VTNAALNIAAAAAHAACARVEWNLGIIAASSRIVSVPVPHFNSLRVVSKG
jgi:hypothetical protein